MVRRERQTMSIHDQTWASDYVNTRSDAHV